MGALCLAQEPRGCAGTALPVQSAVQALRGVVLPFVFRRYLDYNVFESLRSLHRQIREHATKRSAGHPERANDVKLSRGGIREIEFIVQLLQVVRGGQFPELRTPPHAGRLAAPGDRRPHAAGHCTRRWRAPMCSCARWSTASSTWTTSRPMSCPRAMTT
jgi:hypothetical protein